MQTLRKEKTYDAGGGLKKTDLKNSVKAEVKFLAALVLMNILLLFR
jgi:hypothetical protein